MNECPKGPHFILEADLEDPEVLAHLESCLRCSRDAERIRRAFGTLDAALERTRAPRVDAERLIRRSRAGSARRGSAGRAALLAAAVLATVLLVRGADPPIPAGRLHEPSDAAAPDVESPDRNFAVLQTANPNITVVWFYE